MNSSLNYLSFSNNKISHGILLSIFLPPKSKIGRPRIDDRIIINGMLYILFTGCRWMDMPLKYGSYKTA
jgi:transposase